jgi:hypothetical protein
MSATSTTCPKRAGACPPLYVNVAAMVNEELGHGLHGDVAGSRPVTERGHVASAG